MRVLQKESRRKVPAPWEEGSTVPEQVAYILLGIQLSTTNSELPATIIDIQLNHYVQTSIKEVRQINRRNH